MTLSTLFPVVKRFKANRKRIELKRAAKASPRVSLWSVITCPDCGCSKLEPIPERTTLSYTCAECDGVLEPQSWECCVYCSYGSVRCAKGQARA